MIKLFFLADIDLAGFSLVGEGASLWILVPELLFALAAFWVIRKIIWLMNNYE